MKKPALILLGLLLISQAALAAHTCLIGGLRSGLAMGMSVDQHLNDRFWGRFVVEGTTGEDISFTGDNPLLLAADIRTYIGDIGPRKLATSVGLGLVGNYGVRTEFGSSLSVMFEGIYGQEPLSLELGFDYFGDHGHAVCQVGYRYY